MRYAELGMIAGRLEMTTEQMAWGLVGAMAAALGAFIWREITRKDTLEARIESNRQAAEEGLADARKDFTSSLDRITGQFRASMEPLNSTVAGLAQSIAGLDVTMAREYATKDDLKDLKNDVNRALQKARENCRDGCPYRLKLLKGVNHGN